LVFAHQLNGHGGSNNFILPRFSIAFNALAGFMLLFAVAKSLFEIAA
jgi:hypothetical protein